MQLSLVVEGCLAVLHSLQLMVWATMFRILFWVASLHGGLSASKSYHHDAAVQSTGADLDTDERPGISGGGSYPWVEVAHIPGLSNPGRQGTNRFSSNMRGPAPPRS